MENEIYTFKEKIKELITTQKQKVWLAKRHGKRIEYLFKVGKEQFSPPQKIAEAERYVLFGQNVGGLRQELRKLFCQYLAEIE